MDFELSVGRVLWMTGADVYIEICIMKASYSI